MGIKKRFLKFFSIALAGGVLYGFIAVCIMNICLSKDIHHFYMSIDFAEDLLIVLVGNIVIIYGFFAAFLIYIITNIPKWFSDEEYNAYKKVIAKAMNVFASITGFIIAFFGFSLWSIRHLESLRLKYLRLEYLRLEHLSLEPSLEPLSLEHLSLIGLYCDIPATAQAYLIFFMVIISLLGYLVFSLVMGMLQVRAEKT